MKNLYILLRRDFIEQPAEVEGYFSSVRQAKIYIKQQQLDSNDCELYKLADEKDLL